MQRSESAVVNQAWEVVHNGFQDATWDFGDDTGYVDIYDLVTLHNGSQIILHTDNFGFNTLHRADKTNIQSLDEGMEIFSAREQ